MDFPGSHYQSPSQQPRQRAPYPPTEFTWDPAESLEEFNKSTYSTYMQNIDSLPMENNTYRVPSQPQSHPQPHVHVHGPPLPSRPPQHIIDQHISSINQSQRNQTHITPVVQSIQTSIEPIGSSPIRSSPSTSRVRGPRQLPNKFSNPNLASSTYNNDLQSSWSPVQQMIPDPSQYTTPSKQNQYQQQHQNAFTSPIPNASPYTNQDLSFASSPLQPSNRFHSSPATNVPKTTFLPSSPSYLDNQTPSTSPRKSPLRVNTQTHDLEENPFDDVNKLESALSTASITQDLPDTPSLTPSSALRESAAFSPYSDKYDPRSSTRKDPSPTRPSILRGPRQMPSSSSLNNQNAILNNIRSSSPTKVDYYDHRTSWNSAYSVNIIPADELDDFEDNSNVGNDNYEPEYIEVEDDNDDDDLYEPQQPFQYDQEDNEPEPTKTPTKIPPIPRTKSLFNPGEIEIPDSPPPKSSIPTRANTMNTTRSSIAPSSNGEKSLPALPEGLNLPSLPFSSVSLVAHQFEKCTNIQLLSDIFQWSVNLVENWSEGLMISKNEYKRSLKLMISNNAPKLNGYLIDNNIEAIINSFEKQNAIYFDHNTNVHFMDNVKVSGVLPKLTGCYSKSHGHPAQFSSYQCYSSRCSFTIYKPPVPTVPAKESGTSTLGEWAAYWNLNNQALREIDENEVKKQSHIFELIRQQQNIIKLGEIQIREYGQTFKNANPQLLPDVNKFYNDAFNSVKPLIDIHRKHLLEPLLNKINTQGKFITNIGELFLNWAQVATVPYLKYTEKLATVRELIKFEKKRQSAFARWLYKIDQHVTVVQASLDHNRIFFSGFIGHTQLLSLALGSVYKKTSETELDHAMLENSIDEINKLNRKIDEMQDSALQNRHLRLLASRLTWKNSILANDMRLTEPNRRLIKEGAVTRKREKWITSTYYLILIDNYLLITEPQKDEHYKISEKPIPIEFLQIETKNFPTSTSMPNINAAQEGESYPFKVRYTGQNISYTFYTETLAERDSWFDAINQVQTKKVKNSIFEPFKISILTDQFAYEEGEQPQKLPILGKGSNIDIALKSFEQEKSIAKLPLVSRPVMMSEVLCSTTFQFQEKTYLALGLTFGLYITETDNVSNWKRVLELSKITQLEQLDSLMILVSDKALYSFNIVSLLINYYGQNYDSRIVGERLSKRDVSQFRIGTYYNTKLLFSMKTNSITSVSGTRFKVFTPIFNNFGEFQYFQIYKKFQYESECYGISIFNSMFVLHSSKGFEILSFQILNESQPIPKFIESMKKPKTEIDLIKKKLNTTSSLTSANITSSPIKPLSMIKVFQKPQFYLIYDSFAIVIDTIGQLISDKFIFPFKFKCSKISLRENFLICIGDDIVEIFDLSYDDVSGFTKFDPVQIIRGKDIKLIDGHDSKIVMAHPTIQGRQLIFSLDVLV